MLWNVSNIRFNWTPFKCLLQNEKKVNKTILNINIYDIKVVIILVICNSVYALFTHLSMVLFLYAVLLIGLFHVLHSPLRHYLFLNISPLILVYLLNLRQIQLPFLYGWVVPNCLTVRHASNFFLVFPTSSVIQLSIISPPRFRQQFHRCGKMYHLMIETRF